MGKRLYSDDDRLLAVSLRVDGMPYRSIARQIGCSVRQVHDWYHASVYQDAHPEVAGAVQAEVTQRHKRTATALLSEAQQLAASRLLDTIDTLPDPTSWGDAQRLAIITGIASDKLLDHTDGRRGGTQVTVDNRSQTIGLASLDVETLRWLRSLPEDERRQALQLAASNQTQADSPLLIDATPRDDAQPSAER